MAANGRTCQFIASKLRIPVRAIEGYLYQALEILGVARLEDLTYPIIAAHFTSTRSLSAPLRTAFVPPAMAPTSPHTNLVLEDASSLTPALIAAAVPVPALLFSANDHPDDEGRPSSLVVLDAVEAARDAAEAVHILELADHNHDVEHDRELAAAYEFLEQERDTAEHLREAVRTRDVIGQAKGILMERYKISSEDAFALLQNESSHHNRKVVDIATQLTYTGW